MRGGHCSTKGRGALALEGASTLECRAALSSPEVLL